MLKPQTRKLLEELGRTHYGVALREFIDDEKSEIGNILNCQSWDDTLGRKFAVTSLNKLFSFIEEKKVVEKGKTNQYE